METDEGEQPTAGGGGGGGSAASITLLSRQLEHASAYAELATLRAKVRINSAHAKRIDRAYHDALLLAKFHIGFLETSREAAKALAGITHCRWENAIALLRMARPPSPMWR